MKTKDLEIVLSKLFDPYVLRVPDVKKITDLLIKENIIGKQSDIENDHIAFRTLGVPHLGIQSLEKIFLHYGYVKRDYYNFEAKKLNAYWYAPPKDNYPRIFISELRVEELSEKAQTIIKKYTQKINSDPIDILDLDDSEKVGDFFHLPLWEKPTSEDFLALREESEYASWVIYNRYYLNHYTISVHNLPNGFSNLEKFNELLTSKGIKLNSAGNVIKTSPDGLLRQSSTVSKTIEAVFSDQKSIEIAGSYVEFAERGILPEFKNLSSEKIQRKHRRDGFEAANADKIFESTYRSQTKK